jgi:hypothetical protein
MSPRALILVVAALSLGACGAAPERVTTTQPPPRRPALTLAQARAERPGLPRDVFVARHGAPAGGFKRASGGLECGFYDLAGYRPQDLRLRVCFQRGRLAIVATGPPAG